MRLVVLACLLSLAACMPSEFIVLKNPKTGEIVQCHANSGASFFPIAQTAMDNDATEGCAAGYAAAGYQRMN